jgi:integrase
LQKKFRTSKILPKLILKEKSFSPKKLRDAILLECNEEMSPQNISNWFRRNPQTVKELKEKIGDIDAQQDTIRFEMSYWITKDLRSSIPIIQKWIDVMIGRKCADDTIKNRVKVLRRICMGLKVSKKKHEQIIDWKLHPLAMTEEKALQFIAEYIRRGYNDHKIRLVLRNFLKYAKGDEPTGISGEKVFGKYGHIYTTKQKIRMILAWIQAKSYKMYVFCKFMFKTATRATASMLAKLSNFNQADKTIVIYDKGRKRQKQKWTKHVDNELLNDMLPLISNGELFQDIDLVEARKLCKEAYRKFIPELASEIPMPLHFWRHMFAQHMLRATNWNYTLVAMLGGWKDEKTLKDNYGMPPDEIVKQWGLDYVPMI